jgi:hypothetical protein
MVKTEPKKATDFGAGRRTKTPTLLEKDLIPAETL